MVRILAAALLRKGCLEDHGGLLPIVKKNHVLPRIRVGLVSGMDQVKHRGPEACTRDIFQYWRGRLYANL